MIHRKNAGVSDKRLFYNKRITPFERMRRQAISWKRVFAKGTSDNRLLSKIFKELLKLSNMKTMQLTDSKHHKQTTHQKRYTDDTKAYKKVFNIMSLGNSKLKQ